MNEFACSLRLILRVDLLFQRGRDVLDHHAGYRHAAQGTQLAEPVVGDVQIDVEDVCDVRRSVLDLPDICPGRKPPFWDVKGPACPSKTVIQIYYGKR